MGFKPKRRTATMTFPEDHDLYGLEIRVRIPSVGLVMDTPDGNPFRDMFLAHAESWNLTDENDQPVPLTLEGLQTLEAVDFRSILKAWFDYVTGRVSGPLESGSANGQLPPAESLPMEAL